MREKKKYHKTLSIPISVYEDLNYIRKKLSEIYKVDIKLNSVLIKIVSEKKRELEQGKF